MIAGLLFLILFALFTFGGVMPQASAVIQIAALTMALIYLLRGANSGRITVMQSPFNPGALLFAALVLFQLLSPVKGSVYHYATLTALTRYFTYYVFFFLAVNTIKNRRDVHILAGAVLASALVLSFWEVAQRLSGTTIRKIFINPNHYATWVLMAIIFTFAFFIAARNSSRKPAAGDKRENSIKSGFFNFIDSPQPFFFVLAVFASVGLFFSLSRGGMISFAAGMLFLGVITVIHPESRGRHLVVLPFALAVVFILSWLGSERILSEFARMRPESLGAEARLTVWRYTLDIFRDFPAAGSGLGTFSTVFPAYRGDDIIARFFSHAHNEFVELAAETGIIGFMIVFCSFAAFFRGTLRRFLKHRSRTATAFTAGSAAAVFGGLVHGFFDFSFRIPANGLLMGLILAAGTVAGAGRFTASGEIRLKPREIEIKRPVLAKTVLIAVYAALAALIILPPVAGEIARENPPLAARLEPLNAAHRYAAARAHLDSTDPLGPQRAVPHLREAVRLNPYNSRYRQSLGWTYARLGYPEEAERELSRAVELDPANPVRKRAYRHWFPEERL